MAKSFAGKRAVFGVMPAMAELV